MASVRNDTANKVPLPPKDFTPKFSMAAPMVWWMRRRGHSWRANRAMAMAMIAPTVAAIALLAAGAVTDLGALFAIEHAAMGPAMLLAMISYRSEFTHARRAATA